MNKYGIYLWGLTGAVGTVLGVIGIVQLFETKSVLFKIMVVALTFIIIAVAALIITLVNTRRSSNLTEGFIGDKSIMIQENKKYLISMYKNHEYNDVCNIGSVFSRVFYIAAAYKSRYEIGILIFLSAVNLKRDKLCASSLIDTGWTSLLIGSKSAKSFECEGLLYNTPDDFFNQSILYAEKINDYAQISKAYRHLHGYYLTIGNFAEAQKCRLLSEEYLNRLPDCFEKDVMNANLIYCDAETAFLKKDYSESLRLCILADEAKRGIDDETREIRYYAQRGKIEYSMCNIDEASNCFLKGLDAAKKLKRIDEITKNTYGMGLCLIRNGQKHEAEQMVNMMKKKYGSIPLFISDQFFITTYNRLLKGKIDSGGNINA